MRWELIGSACALMVSEGDGHGAVAASRRTATTRLPMQREAWARNIRRGYRMDWSATNPFGFLRRRTWRFGGYGWGFELHIESERVTGDLAPLLQSG